MKKQASSAMGAWDHFRLPLMQTLPGGLLLNRDVFDADVSQAKTSQ
jgi:hypothetical protein